MTQVGDSQVELLHDGAACLPAMLAAIERAASEVLLEMYWFGSDRTGRQFAAALMERAKAGIRVCVTYDAFGSWDADSRMFAELAQAGCQVHCYNPPRRYFPRFPWRRLRRRNHRKMLIVDCNVAFTGGVNLADPWAPDERGHGGFRDDVIRIEGPAALRMREIFVRTFREGIEADEERRDASLPASAGDHTAIADELQVITNEGLRQRRIIDRMYLERIDAARRSVLLTNSYFIPRPAVRRALAVAVARGVEVKLLLAGESDVPGVNYATQWLYDWLLRHGVEIFEWRNGVLHAKTAVFDEQWCTVGTYNFDYRSLNYNLEVNVLIRSDHLSQQLADKTRSDMAQSHAVKLAAWRYRPLSERLLEWVFFRLRRLM